jgi:GxxExxY protein
MTENEISRMIVESAIEVHRTRGGPGLLESVYEEALVWELEQRGLPVKRQVHLPIRNRTSAPVWPWCLTDFGWGD